MFCGRADVEEDAWGIRVFSGRAVYAYLGRRSALPGYVYAIWSGRHVAEPTELTPTELADYWREVTALGRAVERCFAPAKVNYLTLGNGVPHLHTHVVPRPWTDPAPHRPLPFRYLDDHEPDRDGLRDEAARVRGALGDPGDGPGESLTSDPGARPPRTDDG